MARKDHFSTITSQVLDGGNSSTDSSVIGDVKVVIQRHVQIDPHEHPLPFQITLLQRSHAPLSRHLFANLRKPKSKNEKGIRTQMRKRRKDSNFGGDTHNNANGFGGNIGVVWQPARDQVRGVKKRSRKIYRERFVVLVCTTRVRGFCVIINYSVWGTFFLWVARWAQWN